MTRALAVVFLLGCTGASSSSFPPDEGRGCNRSACAADLVCTRDGACLPPDQVRAIHVTWTLSGAAASTTSCAAAPDLELSLDGRGVGGFTFAPVPCVEGQFTVDKLSTAYDRVELRAESHGVQAVAIDASGNAALDLPY